jgi:hypothetical protein
MHALAGDGMTLNWVARTVITDIGAAPVRLGALRAQMIDSQPGLGRRDLRLTLIPVRRRASAIFWARGSSPTDLS